MGNRIKKNSLLVGLIVILLAVVGCGADNKNSRPVLQDRGFDVKPEEYTGTKIYDANFNASLLIYELSEDSTCIKILHKRNSFVRRGTPNVISSTEISYTLKGLKISKVAHSNPKLSRTLYVKGEYKGEVQEYFFLGEMGLNDKIPSFDGEKIVYEKTK